MKLDRVQSVELITGQGTFPGIPSSLKFTLILLAKVMKIISKILSFIR